MTSRGPYRRHSTPFKLQLCQDIRTGVIGRRDAQRSHNISGNLIQLWLTQFDRGELTDEEAEASVIAEYETRIAALERKVGQLTMERILPKETPRMSILSSNERCCVVGWLADNAPSVPALGPRSSLPLGQSIARNSLNCPVSDSPIVWRLSVFLSHMTCQAWAKTCRTTFRSAAFSRCAERPR
jgi:transposase